MLTSHAAQKDKHHLIQDLFFHDVLVAAGLLVLVFGALVPLSTLSSTSKSFLSGSNQTLTGFSFTDVSLAAAGEQVSGGVQVAPSISLAWLDSLVARVDQVFFGLSQPLDLAMSLEVDSQVLGVSHEPQVSNMPQPVERISPWLNQALPRYTNHQASQVLGVSDARPTSLDPEKIPGAGQWQVHTDSVGKVTNPVVIGYELVESEFASLVELMQAVDRVEFYLNDSLVTTDESSPYYLGGDQAGGPMGYELAPGFYKVGVRVYFAAAPDNFYEKSMYLVVE